jgi:hypothetical protein
MRNLRYLLPILIMVVFSGCGLIYGQVMRTSEGVGQMDVISGQMSALRPGSRILVVGPFAKTREAFYICRGEEAATFAQYFNEKGLFRAELSVMPGFDDPAKRVAELKGESASQLQGDFGLREAPELILFGTILSREMTVAPGRGVVMSVSYRLDFYNPQTRQSTVVEVAVRDIFSDCIPDIVDALMEKIARL